MELSTVFESCGVFKSSREDLTVFTLPPPDMDVCNDTCLLDMLFCVNRNISHHIPHSTNARAIESLYSDEMVA